MMTIWYPLSQSPVFKKHQLARWWSLGFRYDQYSFKSRRRFRVFLKTSLRCATVTEKQYLAAERTVLKQFKYEPEMEGCLTSRRKRTID